MKDPLHDELLSAYLDGQLPDEERARVERWIADDAGARRRLDELRAVGAGLKSLPVHRLDEDFAGRVLRAAERRILSEPTSLADAPVPAERPERPSLVRRFLSPRAVVWSGLAVAVAILLSVFPVGEPVVERDVARRSKKSASAASTPVVVAAAEESESESAVGKTTLGATLERDREVPAFRGAKGEAAKPAAPSAEHYVDHKATARRAGKDALVVAPKAKGGAIEMELPKLEGETPALGKAGVAAESAPAESQLGQQAIDGVPPAVGQPQIAAKAVPAPGAVKFPAKGAPPDDSLFILGFQQAPGAGDTPLRRAAQNQAALLVVNCDFSPKAVREEAFNRALASNSIDVVEVQSEEEPLAKQIVTANVGLPTSGYTQDRAKTAGDRAETQAKAGSAGTMGGAMGGMGAVGREGKETAGLSALAPPAAAPAEPAAAEPLASQPAPAKPSEARWARSDLRRSTAQRWSFLADDVDAEIVLVEGSQQQIAATLDELRRRGDVAVSIAPQQAALSRETLGEEWSDRGYSGYGAKSVGKAGAYTPLATLTPQPHDEETAEEAKPGAIPAGPATAPAQQVQEGIAQQARLPEQERLNRRGVAQRLGAVPLAQQTQEAKRVQQPAPQAYGRPIAAGQQAATQRQLAEVRGRGESLQQVLFVLRRAPGAPPVAASRAAADAVVAPQPAQPARQEPAK